MTTKSEYKKEIKKWWKLVEKDFPNKYRVISQIYVTPTERVTLSNKETIDIEDVPGNNIRFIGKEEIDKLIEVLNKIRTKIK